MWFLGQPNRHAHIGCTFSLLLEDEESSSYGRAGALHAIALFCARKKEYEERNIKKARFLFHWEREWHTSICILCPLCCTWGDLHRLIVLSYFFHYAVLSPNYFCGIRVMQDGLAQTVTMSKTIRLSLVVLCLNAHFWLWLLCWEVWEYGSHAFAVDLGADELQGQPCLDSHLSLWEGWYRSLTDWCYSPESLRLSSLFHSLRIWRCVLRSWQSTVLF